MDDDGVDDAQVDDDICDQIVALIAEARSAGWARADVQHVVFEQWPFEEVLTMTLPIPPAAAPEEAE